MKLTAEDRVFVAKTLAVDAGPAEVAYLLDTTYQRVNHLDLISREIRDAVNGKHWVMINTPPQVGKTVTAIEWSAFWLLITNPTHRLILVSYNDDYASERGENVKRLVDEYGEQFGLKIRRGSGSKKRWRLTTGGGLYSTGIQGGITGMTGTGLLIDDYLKDRAEADSARIRASRLAGLLSGAFTRRSPTAPMIMTCTLWHPLEPSQILVERYGRVEDGGKWKVIRLPAFADRHDDPLGRSVGEPLLRVDPAEGHVLTHDEAITWWTEQQRGQNARDWSALFMASPIAGEGALMSDTQIRAAMRPAPDPSTIVRSVIAVDPSDADSIDATGHDKNGIVHVARDRDGKVWIMGDYTMSGSIDKYARRVVDLAASLDVDEIVYERNKGGLAVESVLRSAWSSALAAGRTDAPCPRIVAVTATKNKITRASPVAQQLITGETFIAVNAANPLTDIAAQFMTYQAGSSDSPDNMDAAVWGATHLYRPRRHADTRNVRPQSAYLTR